jgi:hypothetical protein
MDVAHPAHVLARQPLGIAAAEEAVAGVQQQMRRRAGLGHQPVDLVRLSTTVPMWW